MPQTTTPKKRRKKKRRKGKKVKPTPGYMLDKAGGNSRREKRLENQRTARLKEYRQNLRRPQSVQDFRSSPPIDIYSRPDIVKFLQKKKGTYRPKALVPHKSRRPVAYDPPGPGAYDQEASVNLKYKSGLAAGFGGKLCQAPKLAPVPAALAPGPGKYRSPSTFGDCVVSKSAERAAFSRSQRFVELEFIPGMKMAGSSRLTPGPGTYAPERSGKGGGKGGKGGGHSSSTPQFSFGGKNITRGVRPQTCSPGPGRYSATPGVKEELAAEEERRRQRQRQDASSAAAAGAGKKQGGEGAAEGMESRRAVALSSPLIAKPATTKFGKADRFSRYLQPGLGVDGTPAPGEEDCNPGFTYGTTDVSTAQSDKYSAPRFSFGRRDDTDVVRTKHGTLIRVPRAKHQPEVAKREYQRIMRDRKADSLRRGGASGEPSRARQADSTRRSLPEFSFGKGRRFHEKVFLKGNKYGGQDSPGPQYRMPSTLEPRGHSFSSPVKKGKGGKGGEASPDRPEREGKVIPPGPGEYELPPTLQVKQGVKFTRATREKRSKMFASFGEGLGDINRDMAGRDVPGPGTYQAPSKVVGKPEHPKFSFGGKGVSRELRPHTGTSADVGPGRYNSREIRSSVGKQRISRHKNGANFSFGTSTRAKTEQVVAPGIEIAPGTSADSRDLPGPGMYASSSSLGKQWQSTRATAVTPSFSRSGLGPKAGAAGAQQPQSRRAAEQQNAPGPATYSPATASAEGLLSKNAAVVSHAFGTSQRQPLRNNTG